MSRRVVVTGLGALTPIGTGIPKYWQGLLDGHSGANVIEAFDTEAFQAVEVNMIEGNPPPIMLGHKSKGGTCNIFRNKPKPSRNAFHQARLSST